MLAFISVSTFFPFPSWASSIKMPQSLSFWPRHHGCMLLSGLRTLTAKLSIPSTSFDLGLSSRALMLQIIGSQDVGVMELHRWCLMMVTMVMVVDGRAGGVWWDWCDWSMESWLVAKHSIVISIQNTYSSPIWSLRISFHHSVNAQLLDQ